MQGRVVVTQPLVEGTTKILTDAGLKVDLLSAIGPPTPHELQQALAGAAALDAGLPSLRVVANVAVGLDNVDVEAAVSRGVGVSHTPGVLDAATADLAMALLLAVSRRVVEDVDLLRADGWTRFSAAEDLGHDLEGKTLGIVGFGRIGQKVKRRAQAFEMDVIHHARHDTGLPGYQPDLDELLRRSDIVSLHVPLTAETASLLNARRIALLPRGAIVINTARGAVVDEDALADALDSGHLWGAGLDVFVNEPTLSDRLRRAPNLVVTPHIGSATIETRSKMCTMACESVLAVLTGRPYPHLAVEPGHGSTPQH
jgi:glyoxylate reductase